MTAQDLWDTLMAVWFLALVGGIYLAPTLLAQRRHHHQRCAIWALNLLTGWTVAGWIASLVWAWTATPGTRPPQDPPA